MAFRLPISQRLVALREPSGHDEMFLCAARFGEFTAKLEIVLRLAPTVELDPDWNQLPIADVDAALLALRRHLLGERVFAEITCPECGVKGDLSFAVSEYLQAHAPTVPRGISLAPDGWHTLGEVRFRIPTVADYLDATRLSTSVDEIADALESRCIKAASAADQRRASRALERIAPLLAGETDGDCPGCGDRVTAWFEPGEFVLTELRQRATSIYEEVHLLASRYGWSEQSILDLPARSRIMYTELIAAESREYEKRCLPA